MSGSGQDLGNLRCYLSGSCENGLVRGVGMFVSIEVRAVSEVCGIIDLEKLKGRDYTHSCTLILQLRK